MIIDFHTHILPAIDDGARNPACSLEMLKASFAQGVEYIIATPHFYGNRDRLDNFLNRRKEAADIVTQMLREDDSLPGMRLGAEVAYFPGISRAEGMESLCIEGTRTLMLEMPFTIWNTRIIDEVFALAYDRKFTVVLAHVERFLGFPGQRDKLDILSEIPIYLQINADSLQEEKLFKRNRSRELISWFETGKASLMGSDCHNMTDRSPNLMSGRAMLSPAALHRIDLAAQQLMTPIENF